MAKNSSISTGKKALVHTYLPADVRDELRAVAQANHRSISGELRHVIAEHIQQAEKDAGRD
jgi:Arc-like DNA binding domain